MILEPLAAIGPDGSLIPVLATEIPTFNNGGIAADRISITWRLRPDVQWSDGTLFTADDVVFTWQYLANPATASIDAPDVAAVDRVLARDASTVIVSFKQPVGNPYQVFVGATGGILQRRQFEAYAGEGARGAPGNLAPIGTGPYKVTEFVPGTSVTYEANERYRAPTQPAFGQVLILGGGDATSAAREVFVTGDVDYAWNLLVEGQVLRQLMQGGHADLITAASSNVERVIFNLADPRQPLDDSGGASLRKHPFLTDVNVRRALGLAIDRNAIADLYGPAGGATCNVVTAPEPLVSRGTSTMDVCQFNIARANQLLDQAGWTRGADGIRQRSGTRLSVAFQTTENSVRQKEQDIIRSGWQQLGVAIELKALPSSVFFAVDYASPDTALRFGTDVEMFTWGSAQPDQTDYLVRLDQRRDPFKQQQLEGQELQSLLQ